MEIRLREARREDLIAMHEWANDPLYIEMSATGGTIPLDTFARLFAHQLYDDDILLLVIEGIGGDRGVPIGRVRIDADGAISIYIAGGFRGRGLAARAITGAVEFARERLGIETVVARIRCENTPSLRAFEAAGFDYAGESTCKGHPCVEYRLKPTALKHG